MRDDRAQRQDLPPPRPVPQDEAGLSRVLGPPGTRLLVIDAMRLLPGATLADRAGSVVVSRLPSIDRTFIDRVAPDIVVAPLFGASFDIIDLVTRLTESGYAGRVVALSGWLPDPETVAEEIRAGAGRMQVEVFAMRAAP